MAIIMTVVTKITIIRKTIPVLGILFGPFLAHKLHKQYPIRRIRLKITNISIDYAGPDPIQRSKSRQRQ